MKIYILFLSCFLFLSSSLISAQYGQLKVGSARSETDTASLELYEGDICELLLLDGLSTYVKYTTEIEGEPVEFVLAEKSSGYSSSLQKVIVGPATLILQNSGAAATNYGDPNFRRYSILFYKLTRASDMEYRNMNIISIPEDTVGDGKQVVVESSSDLQTWTPVHSSSVSGDKAFFRTRIVNSGE